MHCIPTKEKNEHCLVLVIWGRNATEKEGSQKMSQNDRPFAPNGTKKGNTASSRLSGACWTFTRSVMVSVTVWKKLFLFVEHGIKVSGQYYCDILLSEHIWAAKHAMDDNFVFNTTAHECIAISTYYPPLHYREMLSTFAEYHLWFLLISTCCLLRADFFAFIPMKGCRCMCVSAELADRWN